MQDLKPLQPVTPLHIWLVLTPGVLLLDYAGPADALRMAQEMGAPFALHSCAPQGQLPTSMGLALAGLAPLPPVLPPHSLVLVVGNSNEVVDYALPAAQQVVQWLRTAPRADTVLASICSGALLLAQAGWLHQRPCTTHHSLIGQLRQTAPRAQVLDDRIFVDGGRVLTSAGITTGIDLALYLIEKYASATLAAQVARRLVMYARRGPHDPQTSAWLAHRNHMHPAVHRAQDAMTADPTRSWRLAELAELACVSPRHLSRLFVQHTGVAVKAYHQQLKLARAQALRTQQPGLAMEALALASGFGSARDLRRVWARNIKKDSKLSSIDGN